MTFKIVPAEDLGVWTPIVKVHSTHLNEQGEPIYTHNLKVGESAYQLKERGWVFKTTVVHHDFTPGKVPEVKLDAKIVYMPWLRLLAQQKAGEVKP